MITLAEQQAIKGIDNNWAKKIRVTGGVDNFTQLENQVVDFDLSKLLGIALLQDLQDNPATANNIILLNGGTYTDCNDNLIKFKGVKYILAYLLHHQYIDEVSIQDTASGYVSKSINESQRASLGERKNLKAVSQNIAYSEFENLKNFLNENCDDYPLWISTISKKTFSPKISGIFKTKF